MANLNELGPAVGGFAALAVPWLMARMNPAKPS
jgi:hypothetical protein